MKKANKDKSKKSLLKWIVLGVAVVLLGVGGYFGYQQYQTYLENKVYSTGETIALADFDFTITKAEFKPVNLDLNDDYVKKYGDINTKENCERFSKVKTYDVQLKMNVGASEYNVCIRRNDIRDSATKYVGDNSQLVVDYTIRSKGNVNSKDIQLSLTPDSGRDVTKDSGLYLGGFQKDAQEEFTTSSLFPAPVYQLFGSPTFTHTAYNKSELTGDINKGLERTGYIYTDVRNSENSADVKITYKGETRLVRISR
ncbi:MAG: hypothetical protein ACRD5B_00080 [Nitrososphaeraceae archaeon]